VIGQFRDLDDPDRFVWLRGFPNMADRAASLHAFYTGPVWKQHSRAANETMIDSDDVLLLRPARPGSAFALAGERRNGKRHGLVAAWIRELGADEASVRREIADLGGTVLGCFVTEASENTFPALPVREHERVLVVFAGFPEGGALPTNVLRLEPTARSLLHGGSPATREEQL
jgi:hypothetical protein